MKMLPVVFLWESVETTNHDGVVERRMAMVPLRRYEKVAQRQFVEAEEYPLVVLETRSRASHNAYFAQVNDAFDNLPEDIQARWQNPNHLRKWTLIQLGWYDENEINWDTPIDAMRCARMYRQWDEKLPQNERDYARIWCPSNSTKVIVRVAKSQSASAMGKQAFEDSKRAVLDYLSDVLGVKLSALKKQAGKAA